MSAGARLAGALLALLLFPDDERLVPYGDQAPSPAPLPSAPPIPRPAQGETPPAPADGTLARDGALADAFGAEGQVVSYAFEAQEGELSLFELECWGFARGWAATAGVRILDAKGDVILEAERPGGATFALFAAFVAPAAGTYRYELGARAKWFRYTLVRHSGLRPHAPGEVLHLGARAAAHGHIFGPMDRARFALDAVAGERVVVSVTPLRAHHLDHLHGTRGDLLTQALSDEPRLEAPDIDVALIEARAGGGRSGARGRGASPKYPFFGLAQPGAGDAAAPIQQRLALRAQEAGLLRFDVVARDPVDGGLFALSIERDPPLFDVRCRVGDADDEPLGGVSLLFLLEPSLEVVASAVTADEGVVAVALPAGDYSALLQGGNGAPLERVRARVEGDLELNLVRSDPAPAGGRDGDG